MQPADLKKNTVLNEMLQIYHIVKSDYPFYAIAIFFVTLSFSFLFAPTIFCFNSCQNYCIRDILNSCPLPSLAMPSCNTVNFNLRLNWLEGVRIYSIVSSCWHFHWEWFSESKCNPTSYYWHVCPFYHTTGCTSHLFASDSQQDIW